MAADSKSPAMILTILPPPAYFKISGMMMKGAANADTPDMKLNISSRFSIT